MARKPRRVSPLPLQADVTRMIKGAQAAGMDTKTVRVWPDGSILLSSVAPPQDDGEANGSDNEWDT
jgi:uncharacterized lipoprotein YddW (UPF0748 family)